MAIGKRIPKQDELFIPAAQVATAPAIPSTPNLAPCWPRRVLTSSSKSSALLIIRRADGPASAGVYFRMLFIGYFEGLDSQRGIAWRCADSLGLRPFWVSG